LTAADNGYSGTNYDRPDFKRMMTDIEAGKVSTVIVKDQSRLGRDYLQTGMLMEITFPQYDVRFIAINDGVDSINGINDFSGLKNYINDFYARDTSCKIRAVQRAKGERGERISTTIPYGYMKDPNDPKNIVPDKSAADIRRADSRGRIRFDREFRRTLLRKREYPEGTKPSGYNRLQILR